MASNIAIQRSRVVIIGAGFGGLSAARALSGGPFDVTLVDRYNYHLLPAIALSGRNRCAVASRHRIADPNVFAVSPM